MRPRICLALSTMIASSACIVDAPAYEAPSTGPSTSDYEPPYVLQNPLQVLKVIDGDTIEVLLDGEVERVRLKGIDTPELRPPPPQPFATRARDYTLHHVGTDVELTFDSHCPSPPESHCRDAYGRLLAYVRLANGSDLGSQLLTQGLARVYIFKGEYFDRREAYLDLQAEAQADSMGIWSR